MNEKISKEQLVEKSGRCIRRPHTCTEARKLAEELNLDPGDVGQACNEAKIKISACDWDAFRD
jgi:hypothetical protein